MGELYSERLSAMLATEKKRSFRKRALTLAGLAVVLLTVYALLVPATSLSGEAFCGESEHVHDEGCYTSKLLCTILENETDETHVHDDSCYEVTKVLACDASREGAEISGESSEDVGVLDEALEQSEAVATEHIHDDSCYVEVKTLVCGLEETPSSDQVAHVHTEACYESVLTCDCEEHVHSLACYSNPSADIETYEDWASTLPSEDDLTGVWADDVLVVADSQLGYAESAANYIVDDEGNAKGYTRYGAWYGNAYGDWCAMFVSFCLHYAGIPADSMPLEAGCQKWIEILSQNDINLYRPVVEGVAIVPSGSGEDYSSQVKVEYNPQPGDLIFFNWDSAPDSDHVGLVYELIDATETEPAKIKTIEGNSSDRVQYKIYNLDDESIIGFAELPENPTNDIVLPEEEDIASEQLKSETVVLPEGSTEYDYSYENEDFAFVLHVAGVPVFEVAGENEATADEALAWNQAQLAVTYLPGESEEYQKFSVCVEESAETGDLLDLSAFEFALYIEDKKLDLSQCVLSIDITPKESMTTLPEESLNELSEEGEEIAPEVELGVVLTAMQGGQAAEVLPVESEQSESDAEVAAEVAAFALVEEDQSGEEASAETQEDSIDAAVSSYGLRSTSAFVAQDSTETAVLSLALTNDEPVAFAASQVANPKFEVQYYAYLERAATTGSTSLTVIDTSANGDGQGGNLPKNGVTPNTKFIYLEDASNGKKQVATDTVLTEVYVAKNCEYIYEPSLAYFNRLYENGNYELAEIWVLKAGKEASSTSESDWDVYEDPSIVHFTNREASVKDTDDNKTILISDNTVVRLVFDTSTSVHTNAATFHDYDITNGKMYSDSAGTTVINTQTGTVYAKTERNGINSNENYSGSGAKFAFGNENTRSGLQDEIWNGNYLNRANKTDDEYHGYKGCTFGLASGLSGDGSVVFSSEINAPNVFGTGSANGKTSYNDYSLSFSRVGDTYTLSAVNGTSATNLQYFNNPTCGTTTWTSIWTNNFWPMDSAPSFGTTGHDLKFGNYANRALRKYIGANGEVNNFPVSDDGTDHNSYFGMQYAVQFDLTEDYCGPLEYYFFGDDDMWVFLTSSDGTTQLVCDIGGVHSSVGEYVNLWDYIKKGDSGSYALNFFYTERGASGSSCYMQFTLPSVSSVTPEQNTGMLTVEKQVTGDGAGDTSTEFDFTIKLRDANGNALLDDYAYVRYSATNEVVERDVIVYDGGSFQLKHGERVVIGYLPVGTTYEIVEESADGYIVGHRIGSGSIVASNTATGSIPAASSYSVVYVNELRYELPETGGRGPTWYTLGGSALVAAAFLAYRGVLRRREVERT